MINQFEIHSGLNQRNSQETGKLMQAGL